MHKYITIFVIFLLGALQPAVARSIDQNSLMAAFIFNFAKFSKWPYSDRATPKDAFTICFLGDHPLIDDLETISSGKTIHGLPTRTKLITDKKSFDECMVLYVPAEEDETFLESIKFMVNKSILIICNSQSSFQKGGAIRLFLKDKKVVFDVNLDIAEKQNIVISSRILTLANSVNQTKNGI